MAVLERSFFTGPVLQVAQDLLGCRLIRVCDGQRLGGIIIETEAYDGEQDQACHARRGQTERNRVMYAEGGLAYVYFVYGMHWMLNCVTGPAGYPAAVLIRAILPTEGLEIIARRRQGIPQKTWCSGPARLTRALAIEGSCNGAPLYSPQSDLYIESGIPIPKDQISTSPRVGVQYAGEPWRSLPWRYLAAIDPADIHPYPPE